MIGGLVDAVDRLTKWQRAVPTDPALPYKMASIRETFEECGLALFSVPPSIQNHIIAEWRAKIVNESADFWPKFADAVDLDPHVNQLIPWACWRTPEGESRRYTTHFFLTTLDSVGWPRRNIKDVANPEEGEGLMGAQVDGVEIEHAGWYTPHEALDHFHRKEMHMLPPQYFQLKELSEMGWEEVCAFAKGALTRDVPTIQPTREDSVSNGMASGDKTKQTSMHGPTSVVLKVPFGQGETRVAVAKGRMLGILGDAPSSMPLGGNRSARRGKL